MPLENPNLCSTVSTVSLLSLKTSSLTMIILVILFKNLLKLSIPLNGQRCAHYLHPAAESEVREVLLVACASFHCTT